MIETNYSPQELELLKRTPSLKGSRHRMIQMIQETQGIYEVFV